MALPTCDKCGRHDFTTYKVPGTEATYLVYCTSCGHIVGVIRPS